MIRRIKALSFVIGMLVVFSALTNRDIWGLFAQQSGKKSSEDGQQVKKLGFPFQVIRESLRYDFGKQRSALIYVPMKFYKKDNLDRLFKWYSDQNPSLEEWISVIVRTGPNDSVFGQEIIDSQKLLDGDAYFFRQGEGALPRGGYNEWYTYYSVPEKPETLKTVSLKGTVPTAIRQVTKKWTVSGQRFDIYIEEFDLKKVEPARYYYSFKSFTHLEKKEFSFVSVRLDQMLFSPEKRVRFVGKNLGYVFIGSVFALTKDGGETWLLWSLESSGMIPRHWKDALISDVSIYSSGKGKMIISQINNNKRLTLRTKNYGKEWF
jgi:hypothetical protein